MNFVFKPNMIIAYLIIFIMVVLPKVLDWFGINTLSPIFNPAFTMVAFVVAGFVILIPWMTNPARVMIFLFVILFVALLLTMGIHYGTVNPLEINAVINPFSFFH